MAVLADRNNIRTLLGKNERNLIGPGNPEKEGAEKKRNIRCECKRKTSGQVKCREEEEQN
jgi:hypothetical protein